MAGHGDRGVRAGLDCSSDRTQLGLARGGQAGPFSLVGDRGAQRRGDVGLQVVAGPGGGGYGPALQRDLEAVERDLNGGYISRETAERDYGVVIDQDRTLATGTHRYTLDATASAARRKSLTAGTP
jgi:hypothetical protein